MAEPRNRRTRVRLALILVAVCSLTLTAAPADALTGHAFQSSFTGGGELSAPSKVAVDQTTGDVYVEDPGNGIVDKFDASGNPITSFGTNGQLSVSGLTPYSGITVDNSGGPTEGRLYVDAESGGISAFDPSGNPVLSFGTNGQLGGFGDPCGVAVDSAGHLYVGDFSVGIDKLDSSGTLLNQVPLPRVCDLSVDQTTNDLYATVFNTDVLKYVLSGDTYAPDPFTPVIDPGTTNPDAGTVDSATHDVYVSHFSQVDQFDSSGNPILQFGMADPIHAFGGIAGAQGLAINSSSGNVYVADTNNARVDIFTPFALPDVTTGPASNVGRTSATLTGHIDPAGGSPVIDCHFDYGTDNSYNGPNSGTVPCSGSAPFSGDVTADLSGLPTETTIHYRLDAVNSDGGAHGSDQTFTPHFVEGVTTDPATNLAPTSATLNGSLNPAGVDTSYYFQYGFDTSYGQTTPIGDAGSNPGEASVPAIVVNALQSNLTYHYRIVASNSFGTTYGQDQAFITPGAPSIDDLSSANLTATSADLNAQVNPDGVDTTYRFEYGPTTAYGQVAPVPDGTLSASNSDQAIGVHLDNLVSHIVYHYQLVATNADGTTASGDHTFNFYPPPCPNESVRQQTQANFLPDCRAYELVSPGDAGGTQLYPFGPNTGYATNPSRFSYAGLYSTIPGSGGSPIDGAGDLYVATRTDTGWVSRYVGWPSTQAAVDGGPVLGPPGSASPPGGYGLSSNLGSNGVLNPHGLDGVITDPGMDTFLSFNDGNQGIESIFYKDRENPTPISSNAPYVFAADGTLLDRWPTDLAAVPDGSYPPDSLIYSHGGGELPAGEQPAQTAPGGSRALDCADVLDHPGGGLIANYCPGDVTASSDLSHFVFATEWNLFAPGGQLNPPGSVYDNNTAADTLAVASKTPAGDAIPEEPTDQAGDPLQIPAVSSDGSHILIAAGGTGPCGSADCPLPPCGEDYSATIRCPMQPSHLYMRVDAALTYDVSQGHDVTYVGATEDGSKVYFTTDQQLTPEDTDTSTDLYMWSEATNSLTLVSKGTGGSGNSDACSAAFATKCAVAPYSNRTYCQELSGVNGNCLSDNFIASQNGDIYFFSPEQLDGSRGIPNQDNLYDYRDGQAQYVTTFTSGPFCFRAGCTETPVVRMQISPDDSHMAFVTASPVTSYDNAGHLEMYTYDPSTRTLACASCLPGGAPPTSDVQASMDGLFMTNDGRAFFTTDDALVKSDTNQAQDVYEYVDGRPQLITPGTGESSVPGGVGFFYVNSPGFIGVAADGRDVYFATYDTLVSQDHNGLFIKMYDARSGGGFPAPPPPPGCTAADECHGAGSSPPPAPAIESGVNLGGRGNVSPTPAHHRKKHRKRSHKRHHSRHANANRGGNK
jgi:hypothetical protein